MQLSIKFEATRDCEDDPDELVLTPDMHAHLILVTFAQVAAGAIDIELRASALSVCEQSESLSLHLKQWAKRLENILLEVCAARQMPGAGPLRDSRLPQVEIVEALRDETGRLVGTARRMVPEIAVEV